MGAPCKAGTDGHCTACFAELYLNCLLSLEVASSTEILDLGVAAATWKPALYWTFNPGCQESSVRSIATSLSRLRAGTSEHEVVQSLAHCVLDPFQGPRGCQKPTSHQKECILFISASPISKDTRLSPPSLWALEVAKCVLSLPIHPLT